MELDLSAFEPAMRGSMYTQMILPEEVPLSCPQEHYLRKIAEGGLLCPMDGVAVSFGRDLTDYVLKHPELLFTTCLENTFYCKIAAYF